jgi:hypothetical protein
MIHIVLTQQYFAIEKYSPVNDFIKLAFNR